MSPLARGVAWRSLLVAFAAWLSLGAVTRHPFHTTLAEIELNTKTAMLEIALRAEGFVLEDMLTLRHVKRVDLDTTEGVDEMLLAQVQRALKITSAAGEPVEFRWVGKEVGDREAWVYVEAAMPEGLHGARIENTWGFTFADDWVNTMNVRQGEHRQTIETAADGLRSGDVVMSKRDTASTLGWLMTRARNVDPKTAATLRLRAAEIAAEIDVFAMTTRALREAWPHVTKYAPVAAERPTIARALTCASQHAKHEKNAALAARIDAHVASLAKTDSPIDVALLREIGATLTPPPAPADG